MNKIYMIHQGCKFEGGRTIHISSTLAKALKWVYRFNKEHVDHLLEAKRMGWITTELDPYVSLGDLTWENGYYDQIVIVPTILDEGDE